MFKAEKIIHFTAPHPTAKSAIYEGFPIICLLFMPRINNNECRSDRTLSQNESEIVHFTAPHRIAKFAIYEGFPIICLLFMPRINSHERKLVGTTSLNKFVKVQS